MTHGLGEHFFRHAYGSLVAMLVRRVGVRNTELVEDAVQDALLAGLEAWTHGDLPDNPSAWLYRVAHNRVVGDLRQRARRDRLVQAHPLEDAGAPAAAWAPVLADDVRDDLLCMLFVCCDDTIPVESQVVFALKTLCGFGVPEIAHALFTTEANVYKRLARARDRLRDLPDEPFELAAARYADRLPAVRLVLYLLFTEGYLSSHPEHALRRDLCVEAIRLATVLVEHPRDGSPESCALLALMHLHGARIDARLDDTGGLMLLEAQDRTRWDQDEIQVGLAWLARSAQGPTFSRYHAEAGIAAEHCLAPSFEATRWDRIVECYQQLERIAPSPLHTLNRALAVAEWRGPAHGLEIIDALEPPSWLEGSYLWSATRADLHRRCGHAARARRYRAQAIDLAPTAAIRLALERRLRP